MNSTTQNEVDEILEGFSAALCKKLTEVTSLKMHDFDKVKPMSWDEAKTAITKLIEKARLEERRRLFNEIMERCDDAMKDIIKDLEKL